MIKKFIKGNEERGAEVIKALEDLGGVNINNLEGDFTDFVYYINSHNVIESKHKDYDEAIIVQECFEEIKLEEKKVITNKQFSCWYFNQLFVNNIVQYKYTDDGFVQNQMYNYSEDDNPTPVKYIRINFGEWLPIEETIIFH